jgi:hypothetical protein
VTGLEGAAAYNTGNYCCSGKAIRTTYSECAFVALDIQPEMRMLHIVICGVPFVSEMFLILRRIGRHMIKNVRWSSCNVPVIRARF